MDGWNAITCFPPGEFGLFLGVRACCFCFRECTWLNKKKSADLGSVDSAIRNGIFLEASISSPFSSKKIRLKLADVFLFRKYLPELFFFFGGGA